jgi:ribosomal-protein-alanine N-acetyltransferase
LGYCLFVRTEGYTEILLLGVDLTHRGNGFATQLVRKVISISMSEMTRRVLLNVRAGNSAAISLYQKLFFKITHQRKGFYSNGEDAFEMELLLQPEIKSI